MTVKELIDKLQSLPPKYQNANVLVFETEDFCTYLENAKKIEIDSDNEIIISS